MKTTLAALAALAILSPAGALAADVGVSIQFSQPGVYGRIDVGQYPQPQLVLAQPMIIAPPPVAVAPPEPVYLWVPPGHRRHWERHCREYNACGRPVYFVQDDWYQRNVMRGDRQGRGERDEHRDRHREDERGRGRDHEHEHEHGRDHDRGRGHDD
jgi:hypothetical protein